jgi:hypothetical protein
VSVLLSTADGEDVALNIAPPSSFLRGEEGVRKEEGVGEEGGGDVSMFWDADENSRKAAVAMSLPTPIGGGVEAVSLPPLTLAGGKVETESVLGGERQETVSVSV